MSIQSICRYIYILIFSMVMVSMVTTALAQTDAGTPDTTSLAKVKKTDSSGHQLCLGVDLVHPVQNWYYNDRHSYEFQSDYYLRNEFYAAMELGWGGSDVNYTDLRYNTKNDFLRLGFNKALLPRDRPADWDMMLFGLRIAAAHVSRSPATYNIPDSVWGNTRDTTVAHAKPFMAIWVELTMGMRVAVWNNFVAGWNLRGKIMMNSKSFSNLSPLYIAGYGRGDKNTAFDFNLYISYCIRWKRKSLMAPPATESSKEDLPPATGKSKG